MIQSLLSSAIATGCFLLFALAMVAEVGGEDGGTARPGHSPTAEWEQLIFSHLSRYPEMQVPDLYKLLHQAVLGSEHAVRDTAAARAWLERELKTMGPGPAEPLVDSLRADGRIVRVHLRPFLATGGDPEKLLLAFIRSAASRGDTAELAVAWQAAVDLARAGAVPWPESALTAQIEDLRRLGYPAAHHSEAYNERYRPAYRVIAGSMLSRLLLTLIRQ